MTRRRKPFYKDDIPIVVKETIESIMHHMPISDKDTLFAILSAHSTYCYSAGHSDGYDEGHYDGMHGIDQRVTKVQIN